YSCAGSDPSATHSYSNSDSNCDSYGYSYCFSDSHSYSCGNADRDANVSADAHAAAYSNAEAASDRGATPIACYRIKTQIDPSPICNDPCYSSPVVRRNETRSSLPPWLGRLLIC